MPDQKHIIDDKITLRELLLRTASWLEVFKAKWKVRALALVAGASLGALACSIKGPVYTGDTSLVLDEADGGGMGSMSGTASWLGVKLGAVGFGSGLFQ